MSSVLFRRRNAIFRASRLQIDEHGLWTVFRSFQRETLMLYSEYFFLCYAAKPPRASLFMQSRALV